MVQKPLYQARTQDEFSKLEEKTNRFLKSYIIKGSGQICVSPGGVNGDWIDISPEKHGQISEVSSIAQRPEGTLRRSTPKFVTFDVGETSYLINYTSGEE